MTKSIMSIWQKCNGKHYVTTLQTPVLRIVESQEQVATMTLVSNSLEQSVLEDLLETSKPKSSPEHGGYHYLIQTPFRYPPLRHGSRFGNRMESGLFYASLQLETAFAECAYYRFVFLYGMETLPEKHIVTEHTTFKVNIDSSAGIALNKKPFVRYKKRISDPENYTISQQLGADMRDSGITAFTYHSARDHGLNAGIFAITAIKSKKPYGLQQWLCSTEVNNTAFVSKLNRNTRFSFDLENFLIKSELPHPAT